MISKGFFGKKPCGADVYMYTVTNKSGAIAQILTMGGILRSLYMPDRECNMADIVCGFDSVEDYLADTGYHGSTVNRYGNRIANARFTLNGVTYQLAVNDRDSNHLHGGLVGFNVKMWDAEALEAPGEQGVVLTLVSHDGEENYPGTVNVKVTYTLTDENELKIHYEATSDKDTILNMTNHSYFNLGGFDSGKVTDQLLTINADKFTEVTDILIPTGNTPKVDGTPFDFRVAKPIGKDIDANDAQIEIGGGYDHNFIFTEFDGTLKKQAEMYDEKSGRVMSVITDQPCIQLYSGNGMDDKVPMKGGFKASSRGAVCLETQHAPDSPNHDEWLTTKLCAGEKYDTTTIYAFCVR